VTFALNITLIQSSRKFEAIMHSDTLQIIFLHWKRLLSQTKAIEFSAKGNWIYLHFRSWKWNIFRVRLILVDAVNGVHEK